MTRSVGDVYRNRLALRTGVAGCVPKSAVQRLNTICTCVMSRVFGNLMWCTFLHDNCEGEVAKPELTVFVCIPICGVLCRVAVSLWRRTKYFLKVCPLISGGCPLICGVYLPVTGESAQ